MFESFIKMLQDFDEQAKKFEQAFPAPDWDKLKETGRVKEETEEWEGETIKRRTFTSEDGKQVYTQVIHTGTRHLPRREAALTESLPKRRRLKKAN